jgi:hypothetical protein
MMQVYVVLKEAVYGEREEIMAVLDKEEYALMAVDIANKAESTTYKFKYEAWEVM